jgi:hypothetical protein
MTITILLNMLFFLFGIYIKLPVPEALTVNVNVILAICTKRSVGNDLTLSATERLPLIKLATVPQNGS